MWSQLCNHLRLSSTDKLLSEVLNEKKDTLHKDLISIGVLIK